MLFQDQVETITKEKNKAFKVFTDTKAKFTKAIEKASSFIQENDMEVLKLKDEMELKRATNQTLSMHISTMENSVKQINTIIGE